MMKSILFVLSVVFITSSCTSKKNITTTDDSKIDFSIVQVNDVYEIAPLSDSMGGMARIASLKKQELSKNDNTFLVMAGDFLSPSVYNSLQYEGKRIRGRQMVDAMNAAGFDIAIFGNHEFDITRSELQERLDESSFQWISSNAFAINDQQIIPFTSRRENIPEYYIVNIADNDGTKAKIGFFAITLYTPTSSYVHFNDALESAKKTYDLLKKQCDAVIAITHQEIADDIILAKELSDLPLIVGGHEHDMRFEKMGNTLITKAHSNARSAYVLRLSLDKKKKSVKVVPELKYLDSSVRMDSSTQVVVKRWVDIANANYASLGFDPSRIIITKGDSLEGREMYTRRTPTNLTDLIMKGMHYACPEADIVINNCGSIRLDDILFPPIAEYDLLRTLPFGGSIREVEMKGMLLQQILNVGELNRGTGGYLNFSPNLNIDTAKVYRVALSDFLLRGAEIRLGFLHPDNPLITKVYPETISTADPRSDIRLAIIRYLDAQH